MPNFKKVGKNRGGCVILKKSGKPMKGGSAVCCSILRDGRGEEGEQGTGSGEARNHVQISSS